MAGKNLLSTPSWDKKTGIDKYLKNDQKLREKFGWGKKAKVKKTNSVNAQCYVAARTVHRPCHLYTFDFIMNDTEVIALTPSIEYTMNDNAELQNGRWAMIGIMAALGAYATTGQIIPGIF